VPIRSGKGSYRGTDRKPRQRVLVRATGKREGAGQFLTVERFGVMTGTTMLSTKGTTGDGTSQVSSHQKSVRICGESQCSPRRERLVLQSGKVDFS